MALILFYIMESAIAAPVPPSLTIASTTAAFCCWFREGREREGEEGRTVRQYWFRQEEREGRAVSGWSRMFWFQVARRSPSPLVPRVPMRRAS